MTTEAETQGNLNMAEDIPEDWAAEFNVGHIIMAPADLRRRIVRMNDVRVFAMGTHEPDQAQEDQLDHLSNLSTALGQAGYIIQEFPPGSIGVAPERIAPDAAGAYERYHERLVELREAAEEEGIEWSEASAEDFRAFVTGNPGWRKGSVVLMENGNLRTVWDDDNDDDRHVALQFLGDGHVQYVIFKRRPGAVKVSRVAGADTFDGIKRQVAAFDLSSLVYA